MVTPCPARSGYQMREVEWECDTFGLVLLSDKDLRAEIASGRVRIEPYDDTMVQPSSIDVRLDRFFRVFENHRYPHIDPSQEQPELTRLVEPEADEPFILHPGEFVLGSTYELVTLPDDVASRLEGKSSRAARAADALDGGVHRPGVLRARDAGALERGDAADQAVAGYEDRTALHVPALVAGREPVRVDGGGVAVSGAAGADALAVAPELPPHAHPIRRLIRQSDPTGRVVRGIQHSGGLRCRCFRPIRMR